MSLAQRRRIAIVEAPEWNCRVRLRELSHGQYLQLNADSTVLQQLAMMIVDDDGKQVFAVENANELADLSPFLLERLVKAAQDLNGVSQAALDATIKNSAADLMPVSESV